MARVRIMYWKEIAVIAAVSLPAPAGVAAFSSVAALTWTVALAGTADQPPPSPGSRGARPPNPPLAGPYRPSKAEEAAAEARAFESLLANAIVATTPARVVTLDNGLTVVMRPDTSHPVVAVQMYYKVGARHETIGITGIAHFLEHMLFRGSDHFGPADVTGVVERAGGEWHGYTWLDGTTFFEAAPKSMLSTLLQLEADRMTLARLERTEVDAERGAVFQEYRGYQLNPRSDLFDAVMAILYMQHPYRNNTMGWESDLARITHDDLVTFYNRWYGPRNAVLAIAGDFDLDAAEGQVRREFGRIPARGDDTTTRTIEPPLDGARRVTLHRDNASPALLMSFLAPPATKPTEYAALMVLDAILGQARGLSFEHHSDDLTEGLEVGPWGRFRPIVDSGPAQTLGTAFVPMIYPGHYSIYATPKAERPLYDLETAIFRVLKGADSISGEAIASARRLIVAADSVETDSPLEAAHEMAFWTALGGPEARRAVLEALAVVTPADVRAVAARFNSESAAIGWLLPPEGTPRSAPSRSSQPMPPPWSPNASLPHCDETPSPLDPAPAAVAQVTTERWGDGAALVDSRPGLATFALRATIDARYAPSREVFIDRLRGAAAAIPGRSEAAYRAAACGIEITAVGPDDGRFDERDTLQIEMTGPAASVGPALSILSQMLPTALLSSAQEPGTPTRPEAIARARLEAAVRGARPSGRPPAQDPGTGPETHRSQDLPRAESRLPVYFALVAPVEATGLRARWLGIAQSVSDRLTPHALSATELTAIRRETGGTRAAAPAGSAGATSTGSDATTAATTTAPAATAPTTDAAIARMPPPFTPGEDVVTLPGAVQGRLLIAIPGDRRPVVQDAVAWLLHHNYGGRLGAAAIAETGYVYEMESESSCCHGDQLVWFSMGADPAKLTALTRVLNMVLATIVRDGVFTNAEVDAYRSYLTGHIPVRLAHPDQATRFWTYALLRGWDDKVPAQSAERAATLTGDEVREASKRMLSDASRLTVLVGQ